MRERSDLRVCCLRSRVVPSAVVCSCDNRMTRPFVARWLTFDDVLEHDGGCGRKREWVDGWVLIGPECRTYWGGDGFYVP